MTAFAWAQIESFWLDGNSKITMSDFERPECNSLSLPARASCPGSTPACRTCYAARHTAEDDRRWENFRRVTGATFEQAERLGEYIAKHCTAFRWHVSGDVFSRDYAQWIVSVCRASRISHWIYTRSFQFLDILSEAKNLVVNLSADRWNLRGARRLSQEFGFRIAYKATDDDPIFLPRGSVILPDYQLRGRDLDDPESHPWWQSLSREQRLMVCPADFYGQSEQRRCAKCMRCLV